MSRSAEQQRFPSSISWKTSIAVLICLLSALLWAVWGD